MDQICCILAGWVSELEFFGKMTNGAFDDFLKAKDIAKNLVLLGLGSIESDNQILLGTKLDY